VDVFSPEKRSDIMRRVRSVDTTPEVKVRSMLHRLGFRFRLHRKDLPGKPDIVLPKHSTVIFVHGCFWHRHPGCSRATTPATHQSYWFAKFERTVIRDFDNQSVLSSWGWNVIIVWECELRNPDALLHRLKNEITDPKAVYRQDRENQRLAAEKAGFYGEKE
jgi:DNA mismatch endonuclease, patch repair protein